MRAFSVFAKILIVAANVVCAAALSRSHSGESLVKREVRTKRSHVVSDSSRQHSEDLVHGYLIRSEGAIQHHSIASRSNSSEGQSSVPIGNFNKDANATNAQQRMPNVELPAWAQVLMFVVTTLVLMAIFSCVRNRLYNPVPRAANCERLKVVLEESMERVANLKAELDRRLEELEADADGDDPDVLAQRAFNRNAKETQKAHAKEIHEFAAKVADVPDQLVAQAEAVQDAFTHAIETSRERMEDMTKRQTGEVYSKLLQAVDERTVPDWEPPEWLSAKGDTKMVSLPPLASLMQGALAPAQLNSICYNFEWVLLFDFAILIVQVTVFIVDRKKHCKDEMIWIWQHGITVVSFLDCMGRIIILRWAYQIQEELKGGRQTLAKANEVQTGNGLLDSMAFLSRGGNAYFDAYFKLHSLESSFVYVALQFSNLLLLLWGGFGLYISVHDIILDTFECKAHTALMWQHIYSFIYVMLLTINLPQVVLWMFGKCAGKMFSTKLLRLAKSIDESTFMGMPIAMSMIESFVLSNSSSSIGMLALEEKRELSQLHIQIQEKEKALVDRKEIQEQLQELLAQGSTEKEFMDRMEKKVQGALDQAKPFIGLLAANVNTEKADDPAAADNVNPMGRASSVERSKDRSARIQESIEEDEEGEEEAGRQVDSEPGQ